ncbi:FAD-dependent monooxygenase [Paractinoplanes rishiriensis]|uniref:Monooxygenase n=1 Tax=Paractinoplanes rishiriensis TaxID=1050105 RepID=A0A919JW07_9ACTN|nr:FAD-dependent monooxygenase [Actinoplanes rishiriensis]GIE94615.1 monooxygenase [Actinoplanes rishiriensis]
MDRIAIVGAGIGGLTAALALARRDIESVVFEQQAALPDEGAGIQISPNAAAELRELGLGAAFDTAARPAHREIRRWHDNAVITRTDLGRYDVPYYTMRRGALIGALRRAVIQFGRRCVSVTEESLGFADGSVEHPGTVVGADGLHSVVRGLVAQDRPRYSGFVAARAVLPIAAPPRVTVWLGPQRHCVAYPVDHGRHLNLVVVGPAADPPARPTRVTGGALLAGFDGWHPAVRELIGLAGQAELRALHDRPPIPRWHRGRVVLIGDAAHPMLPFISQGAAQAVEDATTLARCARRPDALAHFEALRRHRVDEVAALSRAGARAFHLEDGDEQRARDRAMAAAPPDSHDWLYGYRVASLFRRCDTSSTRDASPSFRKI